MEDELGVEGRRQILRGVLKGEIPLRGLRELVDRLRLAYYSNLPVGEETFLETVITETGAWSSFPELKRILEDLLAREESWTGKPKA